MSNATEAADEGLDLATPTGSNSARAISIALVIGFSAHKVPLGRRDSLNTRATIEIAELRGTTFEQRQTRVAGATDLIASRSGSVTALNTLGCAA